MSPGSSNSLLSTNREAAASNAALPTLWAGASKFPGASLRLGAEPPPHGSKDDTQFHFTAWPPQWKSLARNPNSGLFEPSRLSGFRPSSILRSSVAHHVREQLPKSVHKLMVSHCGDPLLQPQSSAFSSEFRMRLHRVRDARVFTLGVGVSLPCFPLVLQNTAGRAVGRGSLPRPTGFRDKIQPLFFVRNVSP